MTSDDDEVVMLEGFGLCTLIQRDDPSLVTVRLPSGKCIRIGDKAIERLRKEENRQGHAPKDRGSN